MLAKWLTGDGTWPYPHPTKGWARAKFLLRIFWTGETPPIANEIRQQIETLHKTLSPDMRASAVKSLADMSQRRREGMTENAHKGNFATTAIVGTIAPLLTPAAFAAAGKPVNPAVWILAALAIIMDLAALMLITLANAPKSKIFKAKAKPLVGGLTVLERATQQAEQDAGTLNEGVQHYLNVAQTLHKRTMLIYVERLALRVATLLLCGGIGWAILMITFALTQM